MINFAGPMYDDPAFLCFLPENFNRIKRDANY